MDAPFQNKNSKNASLYPLFFKRSKKNYKSVKLITPQRKITDLDKNRCSRFGVNNWTVTQIAGNVISISFRKAGKIVEELLQVRGDKLFKFFKQIMNKRKENKLMMGKRAEKRAEKDFEEKFTTGEKQQQQQKRQQQQQQ